MNTSMYLVKNKKNFTKSIITIFVFFRNIPATMTKHFESNMEVLVPKIVVEKCSFQYFDVKEISHSLLG